MSATIDPPLSRLIILSNHKLVIAKAKADCDSPPAESRPPHTERRSPAVRRPRAGRVPAVRRVPDADELAVARKLNWLFFGKLDWIFFDT